MTLVLAMFWSQPVWSDSRQDAVVELDRLHQPITDLNKSDELRSTEATFAIAEHYFQSNDLTQAERFYLLTIQKARIILAALPKTPEYSISLPATMDGLVSSLIYFTLLPSLHLTHGKYFRQKTPGCSLG